MIGFFVDFGVWGCVWLGDEVFGLGCVEDCEGRFRWICWVWLLVWRCVWEFFVLFCDLVLWVGGGELFDVLEVLVDD